MKRLLALAVVVTAVLGFAAGAQADADSATHYYVSLGDSLAAGAREAETSTTTRSSSTPTCGKPTRSWSSSGSPAAASRRRRHASAASRRRSS